MAALGLVVSRRFGDGFISEFSDRAKHFLAMSDRDTDFFEVALGEVTENARINAAIGEPLGVLSQVERLEPVRNLLHCGDGHLVVAKRSFPHCGFSRFIPNVCRNGTLSQLTPAPSANG